MSRLGRARPSPPPLPPLDDRNHEIAPEAVETDSARNITPQLTGPEALDVLVGVLHDLRSPLTSILFLAEALRYGRSGPVTELQRRQLGLIYSAALGLSSLANDALELSHEGHQLAAGGPAAFSVIELFESVRGIVRPMAEEKGLEIVMVVPTVLCRTGHAVALSRTLLNLTTNALKFTEEGYVEIRATELDTRRVEFSVRDTGPGINPAALDSLYEPVRRRNQAGVRLSTTGLGLAICRRLVAAMGGELRLESHAGWGTRFSFALDLPPA